MWDRKIDERCRRPIKACCMVRIEEPQSAVCQHCLDRRWVIAGWEAITVVNVLQFSGPLQRGLLDVQEGCAVCRKCQ